MLRKHFAKYQTFYVFATCLIYPVWNEMKFISIISTRAFLGVQDWLSLSDIAVLLLVGAVSMKKPTFLFKVVSRMIFLVSFICLVIAFVMLYRHKAFDESVYIIIFLIATSAYCFWVVIYYLTESLTFKWAKYGNIKYLTYFILMGVFFYLPKYFSLQLGEYLVSRATTMESLKFAGLSTVFWLSIASIIIFFIFFYIYGIVESSFQEKSRQN